MLVVRVSHRVIAWVRLEPQADTWASAGALALAAVGAVAALLGPPSF